MKQALIIISIFFIFSGFRTSNPDAILGVWKDKMGKGHIQIFKQNGKYYGRIIWLKNALNENGQPKSDKKNPDARQRNKPLIGLVMLRDFIYNDGEWSNGHIYNPSDGREYRAYLRLIDYNTMDVRGYIGFSLFGKTDTWLRVR
jgi:uncharacterized protein (DUF2147 family)